MHLYFKDDGKLFLRTKTFDPEIDKEYTKKISVPDHFNIYSDTSIADEEGIENKSELTYDEILAKLTYSEKRLAEYPSIHECIHALLDGGDQLDSLQAQRAGIKSKYPKPE